LADLGATMVEYSVMVPLIALVALSLVQVLGLQVSDMFAPLADFF
jgi:Flp pilus assembly pilin Flp